MKKFLLSLCFLLGLSPAARSSIYLFEQFDDTFLLSGWSVVGTDMNIGIATSSDNGNHWHEGWVQNFGATGNHEISQEIVTEDMGKSLWTTSLTASTTWSPQTKKEP